MTKEASEDLAEGLHQMAQRRDSGVGGGTEAAILFTG